MARVNKPRKDPQTGEWTYPSSEAVLDEVGLKPFREYIEVRRQTVAAHTLWIDLFSVFERMERECEAPAPAFGGGSNLWTWTWRGVLTQCRSYLQMMRTEDAG
ncbi:hypothetical protein ACHAXR_000790 [Thalassiosira sp. AJA248-18]